MKTSTDSENKRYILDKKQTHLKAKAIRMKTTKELAQIKNPKFKTKVKELRMERTQKEKISAYKEY